MSLLSLYRKFDNYAHLLSRKMGARKSSKHYFRMLKEHSIPIRRLTSKQKRQVNEIWGGAVSDFSTHELVYSVTGRFDPYVCSELLFRTNIELKINNFQLKYGFSDKNYFDKLTNGAPMPKTVVRNINGTFLDEEYRPLTYDDVLNIIGKYDSLIVKPSIENGCGKSVKLYSKNDYTDIFTDFKQDYLIQEVLRQHNLLSSLNSSSINVVRVISIYLNGVVSPVNYTLRCGAQGAITDNFVSEDGKGMFVIGINPDGTLKDEAYHSCGEKITVAPNGMEFAGKQLPYFKEALELTTHIHEQLPHFGFIGFDVCFDEDGSPRIMELNFRGPGVLYYQYANGALFGDRTEEIIQTLLK